MSTSNAEARRSLVEAIERMIEKQRKTTEELARRAQVIEDHPARARGRTWRVTRNEILGRRG